MMEIKKCKFRLRCEMGACGNRAEYTIQPARVGIRSSVHVCAGCLDDIAAEGRRIQSERGKAEKPDGRAGAV